MTRAHFFRTFAYILTQRSLTSLKILSKKMGSAKESKNKQFLI